MKKTLSIVLIALLILSCFSACAKPEKQIIGTWKGSESALGVSIETTYVFKEDGTGSINAIGSLSVDMTWTVSENTLSVTTSLLGVDSTETYTMAFEKDTLTLTQEDDSVVLTKQK